MTISLIICTRDRAHALGRCLSYVAAIRHDGPWEAVIVDNGSRDDTPQVIRDFAASVPFPVVQAHQPEPGLSNARNAGVAAAKGDILFFTDDDCYAEPDILDAVRGVFADRLLRFRGSRCFSSRQGSP